MSIPHISQSKATFSHASDITKLQRLGIDSRDTYENERGASAYPFSFRYSWALYEMLLSLIPLGSEVLGHLKLVLQAFDIDRILR